MTLCDTLTCTKIFYNGLLLILERNVFPQSVLDWNITLGHVTSALFSPSRSMLSNFVCDPTVLLQVSVYAVL